MNRRNKGRVFFAFASVVTFNVIASDMKTSMFRIDDNGTCHVYDSSVNPDSKAITGASNPSLEGQSLRSSAARTYRWQDESGVWMYGDAVPPQYKAEAPKGGPRGGIYREELQDRVYDYGPPEAEERPGANWRARFYEAKAETTRLYLEGLRNRLARLESAEYVPECEQALRDRIQETRETIEKHQQDLRQYEVESSKK